MVTYITELLNAYSDELISRKSNSIRIPFETCLAGDRPDEVVPSIVFSSMSKHQMERIAKLLKNQVVSKFPSMKVVSTSKGLALVQNKARQGSGATM